MKSEHNIELLFADDPEMLALLSETSAPPADTNGSLAMRAEITQIEPAITQPSAFHPLVDDSPPPSLIDTQMVEDLLKSMEIHVPQEEADALEIPREEANAPHRHENKITKTISNILFYLLCVSILAGVAVFTLSKDTQKSFLGYRFYHVRTPSMTPQQGGPAGGFYAGDLIVVKLCGADEVSVGDIITFVPGQAATSYLTHRVVDIKHELGGTPGIYFVTRGDANNADDPPIRGDGEQPMLIGKKVFSIRYVGQVFKFVQENVVLSLIFLISAFGCITLLRRYLSITKSKQIKSETVTSALHP